MKTIKMIACILLMAGQYSCGQDAKSSQDETAVVADIQQRSGDPIEPKQEEEKTKLVQTASIILNVTEVKKSSQKIIQLTHSIGGTVMNNHYTSNHMESVELRQSTDSVKVISSCKPAVKLSVRVPSDSLESFLLAIQNNNNGVSEMNYSVSDETLNYKANNLRQRYLSRRAGANTLSDSQAIETADAAVSQIIANDRINTDVAYSAVHLQLTQSAVLTKEVVANTDLSRFQLPFSVRFSDALKTGFDWLLILLIGFTQFWLFVMIAVLSWIALRYYKFQKRNRLAVIPSADNAK
jgi:hypothetical protein